MPPPAPAEADILVVTAHPQMALSRVNRRLMRAAAEAKHPRVEVCDLYARYPDYLIDVPAEQARLERVKLLVWLHPIHWYHMPPLMKLWVDEVFAFGWAYGGGGKALQGKDPWLVASTGGTADSYQPTNYNRYHFDAFVPPYEQTAALCGMRFLPPMLMHGAHRVADDALEAHARTFVDRLQGYPDWPELAELDECPACVVPQDARPDPAQPERELIAHEAG